MSGLSYFEGERGYFEINYAAEPAASEVLTVLE